MIPQPWISVFRSGSSDNILRTTSERNRMDCKFVQLAKRRYSGSETPTRVILSCNSWSRLVRCFERCLYHPNFLVNLDEFVDRAVPSFPSEAYLTCFVARITSSRTLPELSSFLLGDQGFLEGLEPFLNWWFSCRSDTRTAGPRGGGRFSASARVFAGKRFSTR
jgi:hypothetical protein